jgi:Tfp pilus assembly protein PilE
VVLAVLAIIMAIAIPQYAGVREDARVDADMATLASIAKLAEFEYVKQDLVNDDSALMTKLNLPELLSKNFAEGKVFQSKELENIDLKNLETDDIEVSFDTGGKVTSFIIGEATYSYSDGKFVKD